MRLLIVDDEPAARSRLRRLLSAHEGIEIVGEAADAQQALHQMAAHGPEVLMLDIQMPGVSGLDLAASLPDPAPLVVFVTAYDQYALAAFDAAALDYLLKPVEPARLARTLARLRLRLSGPTRVGPTGVGPTESGSTEAGSTAAGLAASDAKEFATCPAQLLVSDRGRTLVVPVADILWIEAAENYVALHTGTAAPLLRRTFSGLLADLGDRFVRCHRSAAVAIDRVRAVRHGSNGDALLELDSGELVACSRPYRAGVLARLASA